MARSEQRGDDFQNDRAMDGSVGVVSARTRYSWVDFVLAAIATGAFVIPLLGWAARSLAQFELSDLSGIFAALLLRSLAFSALQAAASAALSLGMGIYVGTALALKAKERGALRFLSNLIDRAAVFAFALPGVTVALLLIDISKGWPLIPSTGWSAIVLAHVLLNVLLVASHAQRRVDAWQTAGGATLAEAAALLGARGWALWRAALWPLWREELRLWGPLIFWWSFSAFSTVLILGGSPIFSTPEVLLFQSLQNDSSSARMVAIALVQLLAGVFVLRSGMLKSDEIFSTVSGVKKRKPKATPPAARIFFFKQRGANLFWGFFAAALALSVLPLIWLVAVPPLRLLTSGKALVVLQGDVGLAFLNSFAVACGVGGLSALFAWMLVSARASVRRGLVAGLVVSHTFLAALWSNARWDLLVPDDAVGARLLLLVLALSVAQLPLVAYWVERRLRSIPRELIEAAQNLGAQSTTLSRVIYLPLAADVLTRVAALAALASLGEIAISSYFSGDLELLPLLSRKMASRYDFSGTQWILLLMSALTIVALGLARLTERRIQHAKL